MNWPNRGATLIAAALFAIPSSAFAATARQLRSAPGITPAISQALAKMPAWQARLAYRHMFGNRMQMNASGSPFQHIIVIVMENRSVDNLFSGMYGQQFGSSPYHWENVMNIAPYQNPSLGPILNKVELETFGSPEHEHNDFQNEAGGGWSHAAIEYPKNLPSPAPTPITTYSYVDPAETLPYQQLATTFASADSVFQANEGPSFEAHQYLIAGQSGGLNNNPPGYQSPSTAPYAFADNPKGGTQPGPPATIAPFNTDIGPFCGTNATAKADTVNMSLPYGTKGAYPGKPQAACENYDTIFDLLAQYQNQPPANLWEFHAHSANSYWNSPTAVSRLAGSTQNIVVDPWGSEFVGSDLASGSLPEVTFITPCPYDSDHPNSISNTGPLWVAWLINQIGQAQNQAFQNNTAIVLTWDDWGAWYDHVGAPHPLPNIYGVNPDANEWGFRVPMIVISAYPNSQGYVSHTLRSSSSILDFIEWNFGAPVGGLHADDYDSAYAANQNSPDYLQDMFEPSLTVNPVPHPWPTIEPSNYSPTYGAKKQPICPPEKYF